MIIRFYNRTFKRSEFKLHKKSVPLPTTLSLVNLFRRERHLHAIHFDALWSPRGKDSKRSWCTYLHVSLSYRLRRSVWKHLHDATSRIDLIEQTYGRPVDNSYITTCPTLQFHLSLLFAVIISSSSLPIPIPSFSKERKFPPHSRCDCFKQSLDPSPLSFFENVHSAYTDNVPPFPSGPHTYRQGAISSSQWSDFLRLC